MKPSLLLLTLLGFASAGWVMTFSDEFSGDRVNTTKWNTFYKFTARINQEEQFYSSDSFAFNRVAGAVSIIAQKKQQQTHQGLQNYTSGLLTSYNKFKQSYGYFEMRSRHPAFKGFWPAFWLLPEDDRGITGEIDIIEQVMHKPDVAHFTFHCNYSGGATGFSKTNASYASGWHTWGLQWTPGKLIWYVDGGKVAEFNNYCIPNRPAYILANLAVGGGWPGSPLANQTFPQYMDIDYIRAYKYVPTGGISINGPGAGLSYTPVTDPKPTLFAISNPQATPNNVKRGDKMTLTFKAAALSTSNVTADLSVYIVSLTNANLNGTWWKGAINVRASQTQDVSLPLVIPQSFPDGFYRAGLNINGPSGNLMYWQCFEFGVNRIVGRLDQTVATTAPTTAKPSSSSKASSSASTTRTTQNAYLNFKVKGTLDRGMLVNYVAETAEINSERVEIVSVQSVDSKRQESIWEVTLIIKDDESYAVTALDAAEKFAQSVKENPTKFSEQVEVEPVGDVQVGTEGASSDLPSTSVVQTQAQFSSATGLRFGYLILLSVLYFSM